MTPSGVPADAGSLIAELSRRALAEGGNTGVWPGLTIYRFTSPVGPTWEEIQSLSLCIVAQGRKAVTVEGDTYEYDPFHYLVLNSHLHFQAEILEATPAKPFLSFVLQIDPSVVRPVSTDSARTRAPRIPPAPGRGRAAGPERLRVGAGSGAGRRGAALPALHRDQ